MRPLITARTGVRVRVRVRSVVARVIILAAVASAAAHIVWFMQSAEGYGLCWRQIGSVTPIVTGDVVHGAIVVRPSLSGPEHLVRADVVDVVVGPAGTWTFEVNDNKRTLHGGSCLAASELASPLPAVSAAVRLVRFASFGRLGCARDMEEARLNLDLIAGALDEARAASGAFPESADALDAAIGAREVKHIGVRYMFLVRSTPDAFEARAIGFERRVFGDVWAVSHRPGELTTEPFHLQDGCTLSSALDWR